MLTSFSISLSEEQFYKKQDLNYHFISCAQKWFKNWRCKNSTYASSTQFQKNVDIIIVFEIAVKADDVTVIKTSLNVYLLCHLFLLRRFHQLRFGHNFSGKNFLRLTVDEFEAFCESTLQN